jgi:hypothetical protein
MYDRDIRLMIAAVVVLVAAFLGAIALVLRRGGML